MTRPALLTLAFLLCGCTSIQVRDAAGVPRLLGLGWTERLDDGHVLSMSAPGVALRLTGDTSAVTLGWQDTLYFLADGGPSTELVAVAHRAWGLDFGRDYVALGAHRLFEIHAPGADDSFVQLIIYDEREPWRTRIVRKEVR